jgi:hypothetical protein
MIDKMFLDHPRSVDEGYFEHMGVAAGFGIQLFIASLACFIHALVPGLCVRTGSKAIRSLHERMVTSRRHHGPDLAHHGLSGDAI